MFVEDIDGFGDGGGGVEGGEVICVGSGSS